MINLLCGRGVIGKGKITLSHWNLFSMISVLFCTKYPTSICSQYVVHMIQIRWSKIRMLRVLSLTRRTSRTPGRVYFSGESLTSGSWSGNKTKTPMSVHLPCLIIDEAVEIGSRVSTRNIHVRVPTHDIPWCDRRTSLMAIGADIRGKSVINQIYLTGLRACEKSMENVLRRPFATCYIESMFAYVQRKKWRMGT